MNRFPDHLNTSVVTHPSLHMRDVRDAQVILEAVRLNILPLIKRRLLASERDEVQSGHIYVWEEAQDDGGLLRWTDGRRWSQSRMKGDFLFYEEKIETTQEEREAKAARRAHKASDPNAIIQPPMRRKDRPSKPNGLIKQTYSVSAHLPGMPPNKKWHIVAYFSAETRLPVIEDYANLRTINVPPGIFSSNKILGARTEPSDEDEAPEVPYGSPYPHSSSSLYRPPPSSFSHPTASTSESRLPPHLSLETQISAVPRTTLPPISFLLEQLNTSPQPRSPYSGYYPLSSEDRRALDQMKNHFIKVYPRS
ncbi:hypothetical protein BYT27DRAFT_7169748 [Phlegmacium glaucopus]|nr:hypothetical protein BYT27DRAFT_7169748 [Phlegmacium glaucopus]